MATEMMMRKTFQVGFSYVDFDGALKHSTATIDAEDGSFCATNLSTFGCGKYATSISGALVNLMGQRSVMTYTLI
jgi:hypothetical protein